ncbi:hypothetical protein GCM10027098_10730 [Bowmanella dokdonensis]
MLQQMPYLLYRAKHVGLTGLNNAFEEEGPAVVGIRQGQKFYPVVKITGEAWSLKG